MKRITRLLLSCIILFALVPGPFSGHSSFPFSTITPASANNADKNYTTAPSIPAPPGAGPRPTILLAPSHAYQGQTVNVSGQGVSPYPSVRISWLYDNATHTAAVAELSEGSYSQDISVPADLSSGAYQVCASVTGAELAELECAAFTVDTAPNGSISGSIPLGESEGALKRFLRQLGPQALNAFALLRSPTGALVGSAPVQTNGTFQIASVPPGSYSVTIVGSTPLPVQETPVTLLPGQDMQLGSIAEIVPSFCINQPLEKIVSIQQITAEINGVNDKDQLGIYIRNGPQVMVTFSASLNGFTGSVQQVDFYYQEQNGTEHKLGSDSDPLYQLTFDVGQLPETGSGFTKGKLFARPVAAGGGCAEWDSVYINTIGNPLDAPYLDGSLNWIDSDPANPHYFIVGSFQDYPGMPVPFPPLPAYISELDEEFGNSIYGQVVLFQGDLRLNGDVHLQLVRLHREATFLNFPFLEQTEDTLWNTEYTNLSPILQERTEQFAFFTLGDRDDFSISVPVIRLFYGVPYVFSLSFSIAIGIHGGLRYQGNLYPWLGKFDAYLFPSIGPQMTFTVELTLLIFFSGGADLTGALDIIIPAHLDNTRSPQVELEDPCFYWLVSGEVYTSIFWQRDTVWSGQLLDYESEAGCSGLTGSSQAQRANGAPTTPETPSTRWMASPEIATAAAYGSMLATYVDNVTPLAAEPTLKVMARIWDQAEGKWGEASALSDGLHMVHDPAAAWFGSSGNAIVAWTQNTLATPEEAGDDIKNAVAHSEIYYSMKLGPGGWGAPQRLTNDLLPDGFPALLGDADGVALAWVHDLDGDFATRTDWRIQFNHMSAGTLYWETVRTLPNPGYMHSQPSIAGSSGNFTLLYTVDEDGDLETRDRYIQWSTCAPSGACSAAETLDPGHPASSPTFLGDPGYRPIAYVIDENGRGTLSEIWISYLQDGGTVWVHEPILDGKNQPIHGEAPRLIGDPNGHFSLLFRRFEDPGRAGSLGQLYYTNIECANGCSAGRITPLTRDKDMHWQAAMAYVQADRGIELFNVRRRSPALDPPEDRGGKLLPGAQSRVRVTQLSAGGDGLESISIPNLPDPALDADLELSTAHAMPGSSVVVTATVTNLGRESTDQSFTVQLRADDPISGALLGQASYPLASLQPGQSWRAGFTVTAGSGQQPLYAVLTYPADELSTLNNQAYGELGEIPPPEMPTVNVVEGGSPALMISWAEPAVPGVAGYRVLRGAWPSGPFELVGETAHNSFVDWPVARGVGYAYVIQAYDAAGVRSAYSPAAPGFYPLIGLYVPVVRR